MTSTPPVQLKLKPAMATDDQGGRPPVAAPRPGSSSPRPKGSGAADSEAGTSQAAQSDSGRPGSSSGRSQSGSGGPGTGPVPRGSGPGTRPAATGSQPKKAAPPAAGSGQPTRPASSPARPLNEPARPVTAAPASTDTRTAMPVAAQTAAAAAARQQAGERMDAGYRPTPDRNGSGAATAVRLTSPVRPAGARRARLLLTRLEPWSVMKTSFMLSVCIAIVMLVATAILWWTLDVTGVYASVNRTVDDVAGSGTTPFDFLALISFGRVMGVTLILSALEVVLVSAFLTLAAFLYNLVVGIVGGIEVTLTEVP